MDREFDPAGPRARFALWDLSTPPGEVMPGEPVDVSVRIKNVGNIRGQYQTALHVDDAIEDTATVTLEPGEATTVSWTLTRTEPGTYQVRVGHLTDELRVREPVVCDATVTGTHLGPLVVSGGVTCLLEGARVVGPVTVRDGAGLVATAAAIIGPVSASGAAVVELHGTRTVGPVTVRGTSGRLTLSGGTATGPVRLVTNSTGDTPIVVSGNTITGLLACTGNDPAPVDNGTPNRVDGRTTGQCADL